MATIAKVILQQFHIVKGLAFHCESQSFYVICYMLYSYLMAFIKAATVRRDARAFTNVAPTMPGIV